MKRANLIAYGLLCLFSVSLLVYFIPTFTPPFEGEGVPSALLPQVLAWTILLFSAFLFAAECLKRYPERQPSPIRKEQWIHIVKYVVTFTVGILCLSYFGYLAAGVLLLVVLQLLAGQRNFMLLGCIAIVVPCLLYAGIWYGLRTPLP